MFPGFTVNNAIDCAEMYTVSVCQISADNSCCVIVPNLPHDSGSESRARSTFATSLIVARLISAFRIHIMHIIGGGSQKQMRGVATRWIVTEMTNVHVRWDGAVGQFVSKSVRKHVLAFANAAIAVAAGAFSCEPNPAVARSIDLRPESLNNVFGSRRGGILGVHIDLQSMCRATAVSAARGFLMPNYTTYAGAM